MKKTFFLSFLAAAGLGTAGHFLYALWPNALTALIAPVNEGVWEHLKLLYFPPLLVFLILSLRTAKPRRDFWSGALYGVLLGPVLLTAAFYTLTAGFGVRARPAFDIPLYYVCPAAAWIWRLRCSPPPRRRCRSFCPHNPHKKKEKTANNG